MALNTPRKYKPAKIGQTLGDRLIAFGIVMGFAISLLGAGFAAGVAVRLELHREEAGVQAKATNLFAGRAFYSKSIGPVVSANIGDDSRDRRSDSIKEKQRRARRKHVKLVAQDGSHLRWGQESDSMTIHGFLSGTDPSLVLTDNPALWRSTLSWIAVGLGLLTCFGAFKQLIPVTA